MSAMYGFLMYESDLYRRRGWINLGDYVQTIAAKQFLPVSGIPISRDNMSNYHGEPAKMIMNAWYMDSPENFPPSKNIEPFYTSIHINSVVADKFFSTETIAHLKLFSPIGCRDHYTVNLLAKYNIPAYYSGCMTLTLGESYKKVNRTDDVYFVDVMYDSLTLSELTRQPLRFAKRILNGRVLEFSHRMKVINKYFDKDLMSKAKFITQIVPYISFGDGLKMAHDFLLKLSSAKLVVTSRIHTALPCLAMGTPVIFINGGVRNKIDNCRFDGLLELLNRIDVDSKGEGVANFIFPGDRVNCNTIISNGNRHLKYSSALIENCRKFVD